MLDWKLLLFPHSKKVFKPVSVYSMYRGSCDLQVNDVPQSYVIVKTHL